MCASFRLAHRREVMNHRTTYAENKWRQWHQLLLLSGIAAACVYILTDVAAAFAYPGFSYTDQAVSELFAIGAPTSHFVVPLFSLSSSLLFVFALGIAAASKGSRMLRLLAWMFAG